MSESAHEDDFKGLSIKFESRHEMDSDSFLYLKTAIKNAVDIYLKETASREICFTVSKGMRSARPANLTDEDEKTRLSRYKAIPPDERYTFERLVLPQKIKDQILSTLSVFQYQSVIFDTWQLKKVARPMVALSLEGAPGTGKTMAAHAIAHFLKRPILHASYAEIESMYHGEGPKNVQAVFTAAMEQNALLFVDDAESLLSKRLNNVSSGSENAINSMRDQFLICLEQYKGLVVFASNKAEIYDPALETRLWTIHFELPDEDARRGIWRQHLPAELPTTVSIDELAKIDGICGREIRSAVLEIANSMIYKARGDITKVSPANLEDFKLKIEEIKMRRKASPDRPTLSSKTKDFLKEQATKGGLNETVNRQS